MRTDLAVKKGGGRDESFATHLIDSTIFLHFLQKCKKDRKIYFLSGPFSATKKILSASASDLWGSTEKSV